MVGSSSLCVDLCLDERVSSNLYRYVKMNKKLFKMVCKEIVMIDRFFSYLIINTGFAFPTFDFDSSSIIWVT